MTSTPAPAGSGLYRLKPWFADRLVPALDLLHRHHVTPNAVSAAGVGVAGVGGVALALLPPGPLAASVVLAAAVVRLGCANLDGNLARRARPTRLGAIVNEVGDRVADLALLAGLAVHVPGPSGGLMLLASCLPSWIALAASSAGGTRRNGGPVGKTERAALCVAAAAIGAWTVVAAIVAIGSVLTAGLRLRSAAAELGERTVAR